jgi:hypothetical protein
MGEVGRPIGEPVNLNSRKLIRSTKNPMDQCTIVSILPKEINEVKHTIEPGRFHIEPGSPEHPKVLVVGASSWWREIDLDQPMLEIPVSSIQVAHSVIVDYCNGMLECDMADCMPGLFFVMGVETPESIKTKYKSKLEETKAKQNNWYTKLVRVADSLWARSAGNPLCIADDMRIAARSLNLDSKPWLTDFQAPQLSKCKACGGLRNEAYPICPTCKVIDSTHPLAKDLKFAV